MKRLIPRLSTDDAATLNFIQYQVKSAAKYSFRLSDPDLRLHVINWAAENFSYIESVIAKYDVIEERDV